jgi:hypothetical protein
MALGSVYDVPSFDREYGDNLALVSTDAETLTVDVRMGNRVQHAGAASQLAAELETCVADLGLTPTPGDYSGHVAGEEMGYREQDRHLGLVEFRAIAAPGERISMTLSSERVSGVFAFRMNEIISVLADEIL